MDTDLECGRVYWITGLAGSGKTTIGRALYKRLKEMGRHVIFLDGDEMRMVLDNTIGYSIYERKDMGMKYAKLCKIFSEQGLDVVCTTISLYKEVHDFNRRNIKDYREILIECDIDELIRRDKDGLYSRMARGHISNVVGIDLPYDKPENPDLVIDNTEIGIVEEKVDAIIGLDWGAQYNIKRA